MPNFKRIYEGLEKEYFPFNEEPDTSVITCKHVITQNKPIVFVAHEQDGWWHFLCDGEHSISDAVLINLEQLYHYDKTIGKVARLAPGHRAYRESINSPWVID